MIEIGFFSLSCFALPVVLFFDGGFAREIVGCDGASVNEGSEV